MSKQLRLPTLLIISPNPSIRFKMKKHLDDRFFTILAQNRQEAIQAMATSLDFILIDSQTEENDSLELCKDLRKLGNRLTPIFLITGRLKKSFRDQAIDVGVTDFLSDQLDTDEIEKKIAQGKKSASIRDKTVDVIQKIKVPNVAASNHSLKKKAVLTNSALKLLSKAKEEHTKVALLLLQIDEFDTFETKDALYLALYQYIQKLLRENDVLIKMNDGKLILLLANTTPELGKKVALRLSEKIKNHPFSSEKSLTVSIAVSSLEASEKGFSKMIDSAEKSLKTQTDTNLIIPIEEDL